MTTLVMKLRRSGSGLAKSLDGASLVRSHGSKGNACMSGCSFCLRGALALVLWLGGASPDVAWGQEPTTDSRAADAAPASGPSEDEQARLVDEALAQAEAAPEASAAEALARCEQVFAQTKSPRLLWPMAVLHGRLRQPQRGLARLSEYAAKFPAERMPPGREAEMALLRRVLTGQASLGAEAVPATRERGARSAGWVKWTLGGLGAAGMVAGGVLLGLDGRQSCATADQRTCATELGTGGAGAGLLGAGAGLLGAGVVVLLGERLRGPATERPGR